jgi:hypothetical protein
MKPWIASLQKKVECAEFQQRLCDLYKTSWSECAKPDGTLPPDIGSRRERDLYSALQFHGCSITRAASDKEYFNGYKTTADCYIYEKDIPNPVSIKHSMNKLPSFKLRWTADKDMANEAKSFILDSQWIENLLIVQFQRVINQVTIYFIDADIVNDLIHEYKKLKFDPLNISHLFTRNRIFKDKKNTNDRGVEFTTTFKNRIYERCAWKVSFFGDFVGSPEEADRRRMDQMEKCDLKHRSYTVP